MTILDFFSQLKNWQLSKGYFGSWGHALVAVSFVGRFQQESMYGLNTRTKKLAIVKKWPLVKVWLYFGDHKLPLVSPGPIFFFYGVLRGGGGAYKQKVTVYWHVLHVKKSIRNNSRGRVQEIPPPPEMTHGFLIQLVFCKNLCFIILMYFQQFTLCYCLVKSFLFVSAFKTCFCHQSVMPFLSGAPPAKKNPASSLA